MAYQYDYIDGQRVEKNVAARYRLWAADFKRETGCAMYITSGTRTEAEQAKGYADYRAGRTSVKWAKPNESSHCEIGPSGPRALDIRDSGSDAGVTVKHTHRWNVAVRLGKKYGFTWGGWGVPDYEGWHFENHSVTVGSYGGASGKLAEDGELGPATIRAMQKVLGVSQDGEWGYNTTLALQKKLIAAGHKITADGDLGPATIRAMQIFLLGAKNADGKIGPQTIRGLQHYLNAGGKFVIVRPSAPAATGKLVVDGDWGPATTKALQKALGVTQDGEIGPATTKALQTKFGIPVDGDWGPQTTRALQTWLGVTVDGEIGPATTKALQTALNAGKAFTKVTLPAAPTPAPAATPRTPVYPAAVRGWNVPLSSARPAGQVVDRLIVHHQGSINDDEGYFKTNNDRGSCPTWQVKKDGTVVELIAPDQKPSSSGDWNARSVAIETQNTSMAPDWGISDAAHEAIARIAVWVSQRPGSKITLDREHIIGHNETGAATACPGPSMDLDWIVDRARELATAGPGDTVPVERSWLQSTFDKLKQLLGGGA